MLDYQVVWRGLITNKSGLGTATREYIIALNKLGADVKINSLRNYIPETDTEKAQILKHLINKPLAKHKTKVLFYHCHPYNIDLRKERNKYDFIILNTVWETTKIPNNWFPTINRFDAVCVPSQHNIAALKRSGVHVPIFLVPHGSDLSFFPTDKKKFPLPGCEGKFTFVSLFDFQHRKNPEGLLRAYWEEFKPNDNVILVVKTYWSGDKNLENLIPYIIAQYKKKLGIGEKKTAPLKLITQHLNKNELYGFYKLGNAFVLPTRGEGVGLPFIEALSSGIPVITTGWGGQMDFLNSGNAFLVDYKLEKTTKNMKYAIGRKFVHLFAKNGQYWAEPNLHSLRTQMRFAYENPDLCLIKGQQGKKDMLKMSWEAAGVTLKNVIEKVISGKIK